MGKSKRVTIGYKYYMGVQYAICYGPVDAFEAIEAGERLVWDGIATTSRKLSLSKQNLFGGDKKEGGIEGPFYLAMGNAGQAQNSYLQSQLGSDIPAYRGILTGVFNGLISAMTPYIKPWAFRVRRIKSGWDVETWYPEKAEIISGEWPPKRNINAIAGMNAYNGVSFRGGEDDTNYIITVYYNQFDKARDEKVVNVQQRKINKTTLAIVSTTNYNWSLGEQSSNSEIKGVFTACNNSPDMYITISDPPNEYTSPYCVFKRGALYCRINGSDAPFISQQVASVCVIGNVMYGGGFDECKTIHKWNLSRGRTVSAEATVTSGTIAQWAGLGTSDPRCYNTWADGNTIWVAVTNYAYEGGGSAFVNLDADLNYIAHARIGEGYLNNGMTYPADGHTSPGRWKFRSGIGVFYQDRNSFSVYDFGSVTPTPIRVESPTPADDGILIDLGPYDFYINGTIGSLREIPRRDMNPAHIVYECLTNREWGMGYPASSIDLTNFAGVADELYAENFGLSILWNRQDSLRNFIQLVLDHVGGVLRLNRRSGKFEIKLLRDDYVTASLPQVTQSNATLEKWQRASWAETVNELTVTYTGSDFKPSTVTVHNIANIDSQGGIVSKRRTYPGLSSADLAMRVAMRDLRALSTPLAKATIKVNRDGWEWLPGDVVRLVWPPLGIDGPYRVMGINAGTLLDGHMQVELVEDVFGLPESVYSAQQPVGWIPPDNDPKPIDGIAYETPYYELARTLGAADLDYLDSTDCRYSVTVPIPDGAGDLYLDYDLWTATTPTSEFEERDSASLAPWLYTKEPLVREHSTYIALTAEEVARFLEYPVSVGSYGLIYSGISRNAEFVKLKSIVTSGASPHIIVARGVLDTVPQPKSGNGAMVIFCQEYAATDNIDYLYGDQVEFKVQTKTTGGELDEFDAEAQTHAILWRQHRPYPPGNFQMNGESYPEVIVGRVTLTWAHRNRLTQTADIVEQGWSSISPEPNTMYQVTVMDVETGDAIGGPTSLTTTTWEFTDEQEIAFTYSHRPRVWFRVRSYNSSVPDPAALLAPGLLNWQYQEHEADRAGFGFHWGKYYGGITSGEYFDGWSYVRIYGD